MDYGEELKKLLDELQEEAKFNKGDLFVIGCSTSEVIGNKIGTTSSVEVASLLVPKLQSWAKENEIHIAIQGCEHINRSLVVEKETAQLFDLEIVSVLPYREAGGALSEMAMEKFKHPVVVESLKGLGSGGIDIGDTFIGMHIKAVAVPVRLSKSNLGEAHITFVRRRPKLVGGKRAKYE